MIAEPKINYLYVAHLPLLIRNYHYVVGFEVAVNDLEWVQFPQANDQLLCYFSCVVFLQKLMLAYKIEEIAAVDQFGDYVDARGGLKGLLEFQ